MTLHVGHGTLDVALVRRDCIVIATDSRRSRRAQPCGDRTRKLFRLPRERAVAIAGLVDAALPALPDLTLQVPALLEWAIDRFGHLDYFNWDDPPPPPDLPPEFARFWGDNPYVWWTMIEGPLQTIFNIAATYTPQTELWRYGLVGIVAGYRGDREPKLDKLFVQPASGISSWGRPYVGVLRRRDRVHFREPLTWATAGVTELAEAVLSGNVDAGTRSALSRYEGVRKFFERRDHDTLRSISEPEMIELADDLIRATAERYPTVGPAPIQSAILRPHGEMTYQQPIYSTPPISLPADGTWHLGVAFTPDYPFSSQKRGTVFTSCEIRENRFPIPLGDNLFYGSEFWHARFSYDGGKIHFGDNNRLHDCELLVSPGADEAELRTVSALFSRIIKQ